MATESKQFNVPSIECDGCANSIKRSVNKLSGVKTVDVDIDKKTVLVGYDASNTTESDIKDRIEKAGHTVAA